jgi:hypothetical protein
MYRAALLDATRFRAATATVEECSRHDHRINHQRLAALGSRPVGG